MSLVTTSPEMLAFVAGDPQSVGSAMVAGFRLNTFAVCRADKQP
jgi:hypothetical protein